MDNLLLSSFSILIGVAATIIASRHYYRRSIQKELTPFMQLQSNVLSRIDEDVKTDLHIEYKKTKVENLQQMQLLIANTGERAIKEIIKPLRLDLPSNCQIMDANILHVSPDGREVEMQLSDSGNSVQFEFSLLNKDDFFIVKLLINGSPKKSEIVLSIVLDDLPPKLSLKTLDYNQIEKKDKKEKDKFDVGSFFGGVFILFLALSFGLLAHYFDSSLLPVINSPGWEWINSIPFATIASGVGYIFFGILTLTGTAAVGSSVYGDIEFPMKKKFLVPNEFATASYGFTVPEEVMLNWEETANKSFKQD